MAHRPRVTRRAPRRTCSTDVAGRWRVTCARITPLPTRCYGRQPGLRPPPRVCLGGRRCRELPNKATCARSSAPSTFSKCSTTAGTPPLVTAEGGEVTNEGLPVRGRCGDQGADRVGQFGELAVGQAGEGSRHQARSSSMVQPGSSVGLSPRKPREPPNLRVRRRAASTNQCVGKVWARRCRTSQQGPKCRGNQRASEGNLAETEGFEPGPHAEARGRSVAFPLICRGSKLCSWRFRSNRRGSGLRGSYARASLRAAVTVSYA